MFSAARVALARRVLRRRRARAAGDERDRRAVADRPDVLGALHLRGARRPRILPFFDFGSVAIDWMSGCGELGTVETSVFVSMRSPPSRIAASPVAAERRVPKRMLDAALRELALREDGELLVHLGQDPILRVEQHDADLLRIAGRG